MHEEGNAIAVSVLIVPLDRGEVVVEAIVRTDREVCFVGDRHRDPKLFGRNLAQSNGITLLEQRVHQLHRSALVIDGEAQMKEIGQSGGGFRSAL